MRITTISVELEKRVGDNNYGSERSQAQLSAGLDVADDPHAVLDELLATAREYVEQDLRRSPTLEVRRKMSRKLRLCNECGKPLEDDDNYLHPACDELQAERRKREREEQQAQYEAEAREREERWTQAEESAELELAAAGRTREGDEDDDDDRDDYDSGEHPF